MDRPNTSSEGSLFELVARGEKDKYFINKESNKIAGGNIINNFSVHHV
jgi:hypothetical protein